MDNFLEKHSLPKQNQEELDHLNRLIARNEIEYVKIKTTKLNNNNKTLPANKNPGPDASQENSTKHTKILNFSKRLKKEHSQKHSMKPPSP